MAWALSNAAKSAAVDGAKVLCNTGFIDFYDGTRPATPNTALGAGNHLLVSCAFGATAFGASSSGVATANAIANGTIVRAGTASFVRVFEANHTTVVGDADVGTDITIPNAALVVDEVVSIATLTLTQP